MTEEEAVTDPHFIRGQWMLEHQITNVEVLVRFWKVFAGSPAEEKCPNWHML